jgi:hypothetical protein
MGMLRRDLVNFHFVQREGRGGEYRRVNQENAADTRNKPGA